MLCSLAKEELAKLRDTHFFALRKVGLFRFLPPARRVLSFLGSYVDHRLGIKSDQGFYTYPDPAFEQPGFFEGR
jgi:hypothetical protein